MDSDVMNDEARGTREHAMNDAQLFTNSSLIGQQAAEFSYRFLPTVME